MDGYSLRPLTVADAALVGRQRAAMCQDVGQLEAGELPRMAALTEPIVRALLEQSSYFGFAACLREEPARVVGGAGVLLQPRWPWMREGMTTPATTQGLIINVYVEPAHRRRGLARALMLALEAECADRGVTRLTLHASGMGRSLYESLGYAPTNEMELLGPPSRR
jgi:GNAT superfamily N-acetyltransferase